MTRALQSLEAVFLIAGFLIIAACGTRESETPSDPAILATYNGGIVVVEDLDSMVLSLPPAQRWVPVDQAFSRDRQLVRSFVLKGLLLEQAESEEVLFNEEFLSVHEQNRQRVVAEYFLQNTDARVPEITEEAAREYFEANRSNFRQPAQRLTSNIFRRVDSSANLDAAVVEMKGLRERVLNGESFGLLARTYSDSETAEREGDLGWLTRESTPPALADVIFTLDPGIPSQPVRTADGVHLFMVISASEAQDHTFDEVRGRVLAHLNAGEKRDFVAETVDSLPLSEPYFVVDDEEMGFLLQSGDPTIEVFQIGESALDVARFRSLIDQSLANSGATRSPDLPQTLLQALVQRARIYEHCRSDGIFDEPSLSSRLEKVFNNDAITFLRERSLIDEARMDQEALVSYYSTHRLRFSSPLSLDVGLLAVPLPDQDANRVMRRLTDLQREPTDDRLENAAATLGGTVERLEDVALGQIQRWSPKIARLASTVEVGHCSPPVRVGQSIVVIEVSARQEPEPLPFEVVSDHVARAYVEDHRQELYQRWSSRILDDADFQLFEDRVEALAQMDRSTISGRGDQ